MGNNAMSLTDGLKIKSENINLLRFLAALLVIFGHSFALSTGDYDPICALTGDLCSCGALAVAVLFFLSGMYVSASLKRSVDRNSSTPFKISVNFIKRRCDRIFPQLWAVVLISVFVIGAFATTLPIKEYFLSAGTWKYLLNGALIPVHKLPGVFENSLDTTVNGALWTMPVEFAAYCFLAAVSFFCLTVKKPKLAVLAHWAALAAALAAMTYAIYIDNHFFIRVFRPIAFFMIGALYCDYSDKIRLNVPLGLVCLALAAIGFFTPVLNYILPLTLPYAIVSLCLKPKQLKSVGFIGKISYEMYLFGVPTQQVIALLFSGSISPMLMFILSASADILLALCLYTAVEKLNQRIKKKLKKA